MSLTGKRLRNKPKTPNLHLELLDQVAASLSCRERDDEPRQFIVHLAFLSSE